MINQNYTQLKLDIQINMTAIGVFLFTIYFSLLKSFLLPFEIGLAILTFSIALLIFNKLLISQEGIIISRVDIMWLVFLLVFILNIILNNVLTPITFLDIIVYSSAIFFLLFAKSDVVNYDKAFKFIKFLGVFYAFGAIFQYLYTDIYLSSILPLFSHENQDSILKLLRRNSYAGFTSQTAHNAGYIVSGIGVIVFSKWKEKFSTNIISIILIAISLIGLLLTAKRAHLIFMIVAILLTILSSINKKYFIKRVSKLIIGGITIISLAFFLFISINFKDDSPILGFIKELDETVIGIIEGEDISSGRIMLYKNSLALFKEKSIIGIGWREFINNNSIGLIRSDVGSHPHNIYLQLLTELGIIGFILFIIPVIYLYFKTFFTLRKLSNINFLEKWRLGIQFSFFSQTFFLLYGLTGNLLTDYNFLLMYFFASSISLSAMTLIKLEMGEGDKC